MPPTAIDTLIARWRAAGVGVNAGASANDLAALERAVGAPLPEGVRALYSRANGIPNLGFTDDHVHWWPIDQILADPWAQSGLDAHGPYSDLAFADFLICSFGFYLRVRPPGVVTVFAEGTSEEFATFESFVERYLVAPESLGL